MRWHFVEAGASARLHVSLLPETLVPIENRFLGLSLIVKNFQSVASWTYVHLRCGVNNFNGQVEGRHVCLIFPLTALWALEAVVFVDFLGG